MYLSRSSDPSGDKTGLRAWRDIRQPWRRICKRLDADHQSDAGGCRGEDDALKVGLVVVAGAWLQGAGEYERPGRQEQESKIRT